MKKILPYIFIFLLIAQFFVPFSGIKNTTKIAEANSAIKVYGTTTKTDKTITIYALVDFGDQIVSAEESLSVFLFDGENPDNLIKFSDGTYGASLMVKHNHQNEGGSNEILPANIESELKEISKLEGIGVYYKKVFTGLTPNHDYQIRVVARHKGASMWEIIKSSLESQIPGKTTQVIQEYVDKEPDSTTIMQPDPMIIRTSLEGETTNQSGGSFQSFNEEAFLPSCTFSKWAIDDCFAVVLYQLVFKTTSYIFGLSGKFIDATLNYSIQDSSYRSTFVVEGWGIVRDMCNMFFIFILLYVAFATILNLHGFNPKSIIVNVVIIGLLINFSMLATQIIIDTSNIMAKVFYNRISVVKTINGIEVENPGGFGEKKLSEGLVNKVNPQSIIINAGQASVRDSKFNAYTSIDAQAIGGGTFIMVTILASIMNIVGIIAFLSAGLIMVTRVVGLWVAIILSPLAFFSYILPKMQDMEMVGWKKWWPETIKMAFLAPVFIFFMYLITMFLEKGLGAFDADGKTGLDFFIATIVPFAFLMILLMKAKDIAKDMSGKMGQSITNGIAAVGGIALGGAALGTAALGRKFIGGTLAKASRGDTLSQRFMDPSKKSNMNWLQKTGGWVASGGGTGVGVNKFHDWAGNKLNKKQKDVGDVDHARHVMDETTKAAGVVGSDGQALRLKEMTGNDLEKVEKKFNETKRSETESAVRKGFDNKGDILLEDTDTGLQYKGEEAFKAATRKAESDKIMGAPGSVERAAAITAGDVDGSGNLTNTGKEKLKNNLNIKLNAAIKIATDKKLAENFAHIKEEAGTHVNPVTRGFAGVNKNSFDIRKLSDMKSDRREGFFARVPTALIAGIATGVRAGMKNVGLSNGGIKVEGNFMKDLGNTISDSLKNIKVNVDLSHVGEHKSSADAHGGGHDAHGGGGHH